MVAKKKGFYLGLLLSMLGIGSVMQAYKLTIKNKTPFKVEFEISYYGKVEFLKSCRSDKGELASGKSKVIRSGLCMVTAVEADVYERRRYDTPAGRRGSLRAVIKAEPYRASWGRVGDSTWLIEVSGRNQYKVIRKK